MNKQLPITKAIVNHIFDDFGLNNTNNKFSLSNKEYQTNKNLKLSLDNEDNINYPIYGCETKIKDKYLKIILGICDKLENNTSASYAMVIELQDMPAYGLINFDPYVVGVSTDKKQWMYCDTYLQATFLAGMEQIKNNFLNFKPIIDFEPQYQLLIKLIEYQDNL